MTLSHVDRPEHAGAPPRTGAAISPYTVDASAAGDAGRSGGRPERELTSDGIRLAYDDEGSGPAIVFLHAIGHDAQDFARLRERLRDRYRVIALDWPGHGRSARDHVQTSAPRYADLLERLIDALGLSDAIVCGNSIGGAAAILYAARRPERVRALVLENPGGLISTAGRPARIALAAMARFFAAGAHGAWWFPRAFAVYYRTCVLQRAAARAQRRRIVGSAFAIAPVLLEAWRSFALPEADIRHLAGRIACPVLFAWARRDGFVQLRASLSTIRRFPNARLETFAAGHAAHLETPDAFEAALERFLPEVAAQGRTTPPLGASTSVGPGVLPLANGAALAQ